MSVNRKPHQRALQQVFTRIVCPYCLSDRVRVLATKPEQKCRYYECLTCCAFDPKRGTIFKVPERSVVDGEAKR